MDFTLFSHQNALLQGSAAMSPLPQSPHKDIFCIEVIYFGKTRRII